MKFYGAAERNPGINRLDFEWPWSKVKVTEVERSKLFLRITPLRIVTKSRHKNLNAAYPIL